MKILSETEFKSNDGVKLEIIKLDDGSFLANWTDDPASKNKGVFE